MHSNSKNQNQINIYEVMTSNGGLHKFLIEYQQLLDSNTKLKEEK